MDNTATLHLSTPAVLPQAATDALQKAGKSAGEDAKIEKSAKDFEAILLGNWLSSAEDTFAKVPGQDEDEDGATSQFTQMAMQSLGTSFAGSGGIGIAKMIAAQLHRTADIAAEPVNADAATLGPGKNFPLTPEQNTEARR